MTDHLSDVELSGYRARSLPPDRLLAVNAHLFDCDACYLRSVGASELHAAHTVIRDLHASADADLREHPSFEQLAAYVDQDLDDGERVLIDAHLRDCVDCEARTRDLVSASALIDERRTLTPASMPARSESLPLPARDRWWMGWQAAAVMLLASGVLVWALTWPQRAEIARLRDRVAQMQQEQDRVAREAAAAREALAALNADADPRTPAAGVVAAINDAGGRVTLDRQGRVDGLGALPAAHAEMIRGALSSGRVALGALPGRSADTLLGETPDAASFALLGPVGETVETSTPTLRWQPLAGATSYVVVIRDEKGPAEIGSGRLTTTSWTVPRALPRGRTYAWKVHAERGGQEIVSPPPDGPAARFRVVDESALREIAEARRAQATSHLLLGLLYARAGLMKDAEREFQALAAANPSSDLPARLLRGLRPARP